MAGRSVFVYTKLSSQMILKLKYSDKTFMVETFGDHLMGAFKGFENPITLILPVPLHWRPMPFPNGVVCRCVTRA
jgi:predicted amidophosphoribosyltransferase